MNAYTLLTSAVAAGASDLLLSTNHPPAVRIAGKLHLVAKPDDLQITPQFPNRELEDSDRLTEADIRSFLDTIPPPSGENAEDFSRDSEHFPARLRANVSSNEHGPVITVRFLSRDLRTPAELRIPQSVADHVEQRTPGLILVSGPTDAGKSTTIASLLAHALRTQAMHVITIEDPVEYVIPSGLGIVNQRHVPRHAFPLAVENALRQVPDVIVIGELRSAATMQAALDAAESGHLVLASLHARSSVDALQRIVASFPDSARQGALLQLSSALVSSLHQRLLPKHRAPNERVLVTEVLHSTSAVRTSIRANDFHKLPNTIFSGGENQMHNLNQSLLELGSLVDPAAALRLTRETNDR